MISWYRLILLFGIGVKLTGSEVFNDPYIFHQRLIYKDHTNKVASVSKDLEYKQHLSKFQQDRVVYSNVKDHDLLANNEMLINDVFKYAIVSSIGYCQPNDIENKSCENCYILSSTTIKSVNSVGDEVSAFIGIDASTKTVIVTFNVPNLWSNLAFILFTGSTSFHVDKQAKVVTKFLDLAETIFQVIKEDLITIFNHPNYSKYTLTLTGHSIGGAVAMLNGILLKQELEIPYKNIYIYTYGQPRVGNTVLANWYNSHFVNYYRAVNSRDIIPHYLLKANDYSHTTQEIFIDTWGKLHFCQDDILEDPDCSNQYWVYNVNSHHYLGDFHLSC